MQNDLLLEELCFIAHTRNEINLRRHSGRYRKNYYLKAIEVVEAFNVSNYFLRKRCISLDIDAYIKKRDAILVRMQKIREKRNNKPPLKWRKMGLMKLRMLAMKAEADNTRAKYETMEFTLKYRKKVQFLTETLGARLRYKNGAIVAIIFDGTKPKLKCKEITRIAMNYMLENILNQE